MKLEKMKDFIYRISDILLGLVIFIIIIVVFISQLSDWFQIQEMTKKFPTSSLSVSNESKTLNDQNDTSLTYPNASNQEPNAPSKKPVVSEESSIFESSADEAENKPMLDFEIVEGASSEEIANLLYQKRIILSKEKFLTMIHEKNLETKIKAGTFSVPAEASLEDIIQAITN